MAEKKKKIKFTMRGIADMKPAARRILIAKDAISLLKREKITGLHGHYVTNLDYNLDQVRAAPSHDQLHEVLPDWFKEGCSVCALGATLVAAVRRFDELPADRLYRSYHLRATIVDYLRLFFSVEQLSMIEVAFEAGPIFSLPTETAVACIAYQGQCASESLSSTDHLLKIFRNIVRHKGTFVPGDLDY